MYNLLPDVIKDIGASMNIEVIDIFPSFLCMEWEILHVMEFICYEGMIPSLRIMSHLFLHT